MRVGQLDGGVVTMTGMSLLIPAMNVLVLPGILETYEKLDRVREKMAPDFEGMFDKEGFKLVGWGDAGKTRLFSVQPIKSPSDIKSMRPWAWKDDPIFLELYKALAQAPSSSASPRSTRRFRPAWWMSSRPLRSPRLRSSGTRG